MKLSSRENSGYIEYFTLYWFSLENRLHEHCVYMTSWQPFWCDGDLCLKVHLNLVPGVTLLLLRWSGKREEKRLWELGCVRQSNPLVFGFFLWHCGFFFFTQYNAKCVIGLVNTVYIGTFFTKTERSLRPVPLLEKSSWASKVLYSGGKGQPGLGLWSQYRIQRTFHPAFYSECCACE